MYIKKKIEVNGIFIINRPKFFEPGTDAIEDTEEL